MVRELSFEQKKVYFGSGSISMISALLKEKSISRILVCTDKNLMKISFVQKMLDELRKDFYITVFDATTPNPKAYEIRKGVETVKSFCPEAVMAVGGGSVLDAAKLIAMLSCNEGDVLEYTTHYPGRKCFKRKDFYLVGIATTAGSGSYRSG